MLLKDFDFQLPSDLIAQTSVRPRDHSRLLVLDKKTGKMSHDRFYNIVKYLNPNDVLVFNQSKVFPARLFGKKTTGGKVEILLIRSDGVAWEFISRPGIKDGVVVDFGQGVVATIKNSRIIFNIDKATLMDKLNLIGHTPLPPYIHNQEGVAEAKLRQMYQTVYAAEIGSVAAPTAGFHFTKKLLNKLKKMGVQMEFVTLHVGLGTFQPVRSENILEHQMHSEYYAIDPQVAKRLRAAKSKGKRIVAVGTTATRTLETWAQTKKLNGDTRIFIYPGFKFKFTDALITNFHLPKSTLLMLVSALVGREFILKVYQAAIKKKYRFFSFGDAMLITVN